MPNYEYQCGACGKKFSLFMSYAAYDRAEVRCPECTSADVRRIIRPVRVAIGDKNRLWNVASEIGRDDSSAALGKVMRTVQQTSGKSLAPEYEEVLTRMESGESREAIDKDYD